jgi:hypothetical protein
MAISILQWLFDELMAENQFLLIFYQKFKPGLED